MVSQKSGRDSIIIMKMVIFNRAQRGFIILYETGYLKRVLRGGSTNSKAGCYFPRHQRGLQSSSMDRRGQGDEF